MDVIRPSLHALDVYGADRYETAPTWGPGLCSDPYRAGAFYPWRSAP